MLYIYIFLMYIYKYTRFIYIYIYIYNLQIFDRTLDMVYELKGRKYICIFENIKTLQIILSNQIPACSKLQVPKVKHDYQI